MSAFRFRLYWLFGCLCLTRQGGYAISCQNNLELHLGCHACWLSYFTLLCLWCGRTVGWTYDHAITKISRMDRLPHFLRYGATLARVELRYKQTNRPFAIANHVINFSKHENSLLLENSVSRNWKSILKLSNLWTISRSQKERLERPPKIRRICMRKTTLVT